MKLDTNELTYNTELKMAETAEICEVGVLQKCNADLFSLLLHKVINRMCDKGDHPSYNSYSALWDLGEFWKVTAFCEAVVMRAGKLGMTKDQIIESVSWAPGPIRQSFCDVISSRRDELHTHLLQKSCLVSQSSLTDFDWQLKLVMSSDKMSSFHEPLLNVDMMVQHHNTNHSSNNNRTVSVELNHADLKRTISALEAANKVIQQLKT